MGILEIYRRQWGAPGSSKAAWRTSLQSLSLLFYSFTKVLNSHLPVGCCRQWDFFLTQSAINWRRNRKEASWCLVTLFKSKGCRMSNWTLPAVMCLNGHEFVFLEPGGGEFPQTGPMHHSRNKRLCSIRSSLCYQTRPNFPTVQCTGSEILNVGTEKKIDMKWLNIWRWKGMTQMCLLKIRARRLEINETGPWPRKSWLNVSTDAVK